MYKLILIYEKKLFILNFNFTIKFLLRSLCKSLLTIQKHLYKKV